MMMSRTSSRVNAHSILCMNVKELLAWSRRHIWSLSETNEVRTHNNLARKRTLNHLAKLANWLSWVVSTYLYGAFGRIFLSCHVRNSEWIHNIVCLNVKELLARRNHHIWTLSDSNEIRTNNHLSCKPTRNHRGKLVKWLSCVARTYLYGGFDCMLLSCHVRIPEWIHRL